MSLHDANNDSLRSGRIISHGTTYNASMRRLVPTTMPFIEDLVRHIHIYKHIEEQYYEAAIYSGQFAISTPSYFNEKSLGVRADENEGVQSVELSMDNDSPAESKYARDSISDAIHGVDSAKINYSSCHARLIQSTEPAALMSFTMRPSANTRKKFGDRVVKIEDPVGFKRKIDSHLKQQYGVCCGDMRAINYYSMEKADLIKKISTHPAYMKPSKTKDNNYREENEFRMLWPISPILSEKHDFSQPLILTIPSLREHLIPIPELSISMPGFLPHTQVAHSFDQSVFPPIEMLKYETHDHPTTLEYIEQCRRRHQEELSKRV